PRRGAFRAEPAAKLVARPAVEHCAPQPRLLVVLGQRGDLGVVPEAEVVPPAGRVEPGGDPGVVAQRLVVEAGRRDRLPVAATVLRLTVDEPVADPPARRVVDQADVLPDSLPELVRQPLLEVECGPRRGDPSERSIRPAGK